MNRHRWLSQPFAVASGAAAAIALIAAPSQAASFTIDDIGGIWSNVQGPAATAGTFSGEGTSEVRWGNAFDGSAGNSGLGFEATGGPLMLTSGSSFVLGKLTHFNYTIFAGTEATGVDLALSMAIDGVLQTFGYQFTIDETPNTATLAGCPDFQMTGVPCDDKIDFTSPFSGTTFAKNGTNYTLEILGFSSTSDGLSPVTSFITEEFKETSAFLVARVVVDPASVPEPALGLGLVLVGLGAAKLRGQKDEEAAV